MRASLFLFCGCLLCACTGSDGQAAAQIGAAMRLDLYRFGGTLGDYASVTVPYTEAVPVQRLANVVADLNGDGVIADYAAAGSTQTEWVVRNMPLLVGNAGASTYFPLVDLAVAGAPTVRVRVVLGDAELPAAPPLGMHDPDSLETDVAVRVINRLLAPEPPAGFAGGGVESLPEDDWLGETAGTDLDLGSASYRPGLPDAPQGQNTCVLHAIAGSVSWLSRANDFRTKIDDEEAGIDVGTPEGINNLAFQIDELGQMNYDPVVGVLTNVIFDGKNRYVQAKKLPIETRQVTTNLFAEIQQAMHDGCTVELVLTFAGGGAHMVGVAGFSDIQLPSGPSKTLTVHDTETTTFNDTYRLEADGSGTESLDGFPFRGVRQTATLQFAIIQCYKPFVIPGQDDVVDGKVPVPCLVINGLNYPLYQFRLSHSPQDTCTDPHWHADKAVFPLDPPQGMTGERTDPDPDNCGFGREADVPQSLPKVDFDDWQQFLGAHPP